LFVDSFCCAQLVSLIQSRRRLSIAEGTPTFEGQTAAAFPPESALGIASAAQNAVRELQEAQTRSVGPTGRRGSTRRLPVLRSEADQITTRDERLNSDATTAKSKVRRNSQGSVGDIFSTPTDTTVASTATGGQDFAVDFTVNASIAVAANGDYWAKREQYVRLCEDAICPPLWRPIVLWKT
jgi:hypothetical protein